MTAPFEDKIIEFIAGKRPLKLLFMLVATVGLFGSAYKTVQPVVERFQPFLYRLLDVQLEPADRQKYECAYFSGGAQWNLPAAARVASSLSPDAMAKNLAIYQGRLSMCLNALGYSTPGNWPTASTEIMEIERAQAATIGVLNSFSGSLLAKDRLTYLLHQIGNDAAFVLTQLEPSSPEERMTMIASLLPYEADVARRLTVSLAEARTLCTCRLPTVVIVTKDRQGLLNSSRQLDELMSRLFSSDEPTT